MFKTGNLRTSSSDNIFDTTFHLNTIGAHGYYVLK